MKPKEIPRPVGEIIKQWMKESHIERNMVLFQIRRDWEKIAGQHIAGATQQIFLHNNILYVKISSSVLKQEMMMIRSAIAQRINAAYYSNLIKEIRVI